MAEEEQGQQAPQAPTIEERLAHLEEAIKDSLSRHAALTEKLKQHGIETE
jgi:hypothetical protein